ncbi:sensor histidine kinase [Enterococcus sp. DIV0724b]|uniref:sensor histidine kinase n=1 Tax=Enterococcus sp. DIV0724b TaxID=2774694 RepID=UPI003D2FEA8C
MLLLVWTISYALPNLILSASPNLSLLLLLSQPVLLIIVCLLMRFYIKKYDFFLILKSVQKKYRLLSLAIFLFFGILFSIYRLIVDTISVQTLTFVFLLICLSGFLFSFFFYLIASSYNQRQAYLTLSKSMNSVKERYETTIEFRHDYKNILTSINGYLSDGHIADAQNYIQSIINYSSSILVPEYYSQLLNLAIPPIQAVLLSFFEQVSSKGITLYVNIPQKIYQVDMDLIDLTRCLSILLDNALEAHQKDSNYIIQVSITQEENQIIIMIKNSFNLNKDISLSKMFEDNYTTKDGHRGKGLTIINKITSEYTNVTIDFWLEDDFITASLLINTLTL